MNDCVNTINVEVPDPTPPSSRAFPLISMIHVSIGDLAMHSFGKDVQQPRAEAGHSPALLQVVIALRRSQLHDGAAANAGTPSNGGHMGSSQASLSFGTDGDFGGVLAIDMLKFDDEIPALDLRVSHVLLACSSGYVPRTRYSLGFVFSTAVV